MAQRLSGPPLPNWGFRRQRRGTINKMGCGLDHARAMSFVCHCMILTLTEAVTGPGAGTFYLYPGTDSTGCLTGSDAASPWIAHLAAKRNRTVQ